MNFAMLRQAFILSLMISVSFLGLAQNDKGYNKSFSKSSLKKKVVKTRSDIEPLNEGTTDNSTANKGNNDGGDLQPEEGGLNDNRWLFSIDDDSIEVADFLYVYNKNSIQGEEKFTKQSLNDYLQLYINFRLKVKEAEDLGMDTITSLMSELDTYRKQLSKSYLYDRDVSEQLLEEAYQRMQKEVNTSHILIKIDEPGLPSDTLKAYKEAMSIRKKLLAGEDFSTLAKKHSSDPSAQYNGGNIGWFTVMQTVYPFETAAYNTPKGKISMPVRTRFGYHLVKVEDMRDAQGEITVAHIMVKLPENASDEQIKQAQEKANTIYEKATGGSNWDELVKEYSDDKTTRLKGGELPPFSTGRMVETFESAAFGLKKDGDISKPVQTEYGFHIIKRLSKKPQPTFDEVKTELKKKIERDSRSEIAKTTLLEKIKEEYGFRDYSKYKNTLYNKIGKDLPGGKFKVDDKTGYTKPLFEIADTKYTEADFIEYLEASAQKKRADPAEKIFNDYYDKFLETSLLAYEESQLERKYPEFRLLMKEYRDGILLFELTNEKVWNKAIKDTAGLKAYYETIKTNYMWPERIKADVYTVTDPSLAKKIYKVLDKKGKDAMLKKFNKEGEKPVVSVKSGIYSKNDNNLIDNNWKAGLGEPVEKDGVVQFVNVTEVMAPMPKSLNEAKGFIVSDYQEYLEDQWIKDLRNKYSVEVNQGVLNSLIK